MRLKDRKIYIKCKICTGKELIQIRVETNKADHKINIRVH